MASNGFVFISPGVKFREVDLTFVTQTVGLTTLGLVGETTKGPAFEPIPIADKSEFRTRFGGQSTEKIGDDLKYTLPYYANSYLDESNQLFVTRILGLSGYNAGLGWAIVASAGLDPSTSGSTGTSTFTDTFSGSTYEGEIISQTGGTFVTDPVFVKTTGTAFTGENITFTVTSYDSLNGTGDTSGFTTTYSGTSYEEYENMVLGIVRSRANYVNNDLTFEATALTISSGAESDGLGEFTLTVNGGQETALVSLDIDSRDYISRVIGDKPKGRTNKIYVEAVYPQLIKKLDAEGFLYGIKSSLVDLTTNVFTDYTEQYQTPETPWVVSELKGNSISRLFKFVSISDGDAANKEIKISIQNIDPATREFDVVVRDFNDSDDNPVILESFTRCTMQPTLNNYVGSRIGTMDGKYTLNSSYIMLVLNESELVNDAFPAGFEGYEFRSYSEETTGSVSAQTPQIFYKTGYTDSDRISKTYLGVSEKGYDSGTYDANGVNQNFFNYYGAVETASSLYKTKGFHMDSGATSNYSVGDEDTPQIGEFQTGEGRFRTAADIATTSSPYNDRFSRKFTLVPAGGFDGWDGHRTSRSNTDLFREGGVYYSADSDYYAYLQAIQTFENPEEVDINLISTPGINWSDHLGLVNETIILAEETRGDTLYVIDAPDISNSATLAEDYTDLLETTQIDSNYSCTFAPWIEMRDEQNGVNVFIPPTGEVIRAMAFTDNAQGPWFAPAGLNRGTTFARRARRKLSTSERDTLYDGRINPMATFADVGVAIFGQKTLQVAESSLDRINVRRLLLRLRKLIANISVRLLFEQNDQVVRDEFIAKVTPVLDQIRQNRGISDFRIKIDDSINTPESVDRNELYAEISIKPISSLEFIAVTFILTPTGASFADI
ncbi:MAG: phage tail sheath C-terminal domain-containing protein [bacterium]